MMEKIIIQRDDIKVSIEKTERVEGMTWTEITKVYTDCLIGLGYSPIELEELITKKEDI